MPADPDEEPRPVARHVVGEDLSRLSIEEIAARITLLKEEISRLEAAAAAKSVHRSAAESVFRSG